MSKTIAYVRVSTDKQDLDHQKLEILEFARKKDIKVDEFIEVKMSTRRCTKQRRIDELMEALKDDLDTLIVTELSRLGRSTTEVVTLVNTLTERNIRLIVIKQGLDFSKSDMNSKLCVHMFSLVGEIERDLISSRIRESLASKKSKGQILGKPKGTLQKSKFDQHIEKIKELLGYGLPVTKIATVLGFNNHKALAVYIKKRNIKETITNLGEKH